MLKSDERFRAAAVELRVNDGEVFLKGSFVNIRDPSRLKHMVAEIEGVIEIRVSAVFRT